MLLAALGICAKLEEEGKVAEAAGPSRGHSLSSRMPNDRWDQKLLDPRVSDIEGSSQ